MKLNFSVVFVQEECVYESRYPRIVPSHAAERRRDTGDDIPAAFLTHERDAHGHSVRAVEHGGGYHRAMLDED